MIPLCLLLSTFYFQSISGFVFWTCNSLDCAVKHSFGRNGLMGVSLGFAFMGRNLFLKCNTSNSA